MKRSPEPLFWSLFGAGGMLAALVGPVLIFVIGIALPLGWLAPQTLDYTRLLAWAHHPLAKLALLGVISLFLFHGGHRLRHSLHDLGWHPGRVATVVFYGTPALATLLAAWRLLAIGF